MQSDAKKRQGIFGFIADNPVVFLTRYIWRYGDKKKIILFTSLFVLANLIALIQPLIIGYIL